MNIDSDPLQVREAYVVEPIGINMVEITDFDMEAEDEAFKNNEIEVVYPRPVKVFLNFSTDAKSRIHKLCCALGVVLFFITRLQRKWRVPSRRRGRKTGGRTSLSSISTRGESLGKMSNFSTIREVSLALMCQLRILLKGGGRGLLERSNLEIRGRGMSK